MESVVYLYSKYSSRCKKFSEMINTTTLKDSFNNLCIDNKDLRKVVISSKYAIKSLPCVLCFFPNSVVEKYEGDHAFRWLEQFVIPTPPPPARLPPPVEEETEEEEEVVSQRVQKKKTRKQISNETSVQKTSIEDILASNEDEDSEDEDEKVEEITASDINTMIKKSTKQSKVTDIMSMAQQLQKMREDEEADKTKKK